MRLAFRFEDLREDPEPLTQGRFAEHPQVVDERALRLTLNLHCNGPAQIGYAGGALHQIAVQ